MKLMDLYVALTMNSASFEEGMKKAQGIATSGLTKIGNAAKVGAMQLAGQVADSVKQMISSAVGSYGEYEQLIGGVETLYKQSSDTIVKNAKSAFSRAGMSANEYMNTATSFAATLVQGLGGDTEEAAKLADMAITDMSDNANKMGTSMESVQSAYMAFAKQNYTLLDNLKLGRDAVAELKNLVKTVKLLLYRTIPCEA